MGGFGGPGFGQPGFGPAGFGAPFPGGNPVVASPIQPGQPGTTFQGTTSVLDNRFGENEVPVVTGGTQTVTSNNGNYHVHTSVLKPDGQVVHSHQSGKFPGKKVDKVEKTEKLDKPVKSDKTETTDKREKSDKTEKTPEKKE